MSRKIRYGMVGGGRGAFIGAGAVVTSSVQPFALMVGVPARQVGWMSAHGERIPLPLSGSGRWVCPHTGACYVLEGSDLRQYLES